MNGSKPINKDQNLNTTKLDTDFMNDTTLITNISDINISSSSSGSKQLRNATFSSIERMELKKKTHAELKQKLREDNQKMFEKAVNISYERIKTVHSIKPLTVPKTPFLRTEKRNNPILNELSPIKPTKGRFVKKDIIDRLNKSTANLLKKLDVLDDFKAPSRPPKKNSKFVPKNTIPKPFKFNEIKRTTKKATTHYVPIKKVEAKKVNIKRILYKTPKLPVKYNKSTLATKTYKKNPEEYISTLPRFSKLEQQQKNVKKSINKKTVPKPFYLRSMEAHDKAVRIREIERKMKEEHEKTEKEEIKRRTKRKLVKYKTQKNAKTNINTRNSKTENKKDEDIKTYRKKLEFKASKLPKFYKKLNTIKENETNKVERSEKLNTNDNKNVGSIKYIQRTNKQDK